MTREEAKQLLPVIKAFAEGKTIEYQAPDGVWCEASRQRLNVGFDQGAERYRIKSEPKYRPFENGEECWAEMLKHQPFGWLRKIDEEFTTRYDQIHSVMDASLWLDDDADNGLGFSDVMEDYTFADGQHFGIKVEEEE